MVETWSARRERPFVGRTAELDVLVAALHAAPGVALVSGEPGIGKTRLLEQLAYRAAEAGALVLAGACIELSVAVPYLPLIEALRRESLTLPAAGAMLSPDLARARLFGELADLLAQIGDGRPVLLMVDDLQ